MMNEKELEKKSPFAVCEGETFEQVSVDGAHYVDLTDFQSEIIKSINQFLVMTRLQVTQSLLYKGFTTEPEIVSRQLKYLMKNGYIDGFNFKDNEGNIKTRFYMVGRKGGGWLASVKEPRRLHGYLQQCTLVQIKKILSANQAVFSLGLINEGNCISSKIIKNNQEYHAELLFRAGTIVQGNGRNIMLESVRKISGYEEELYEKLKRINKTIHSQKSEVLPSQDNSIIIVSEDREMMEYLIKLFERKHYKEFSVFITYDRLLVSEEEDKLFQIRKKSILKRILAA